MAERMIAEVGVEDNTQNIIDATRAFYRNNRDVILVVGIVALTLYVNRRMLRKELRNLNFNVEVFPGYFDDDGLGGEPFGSEADL